MMPDPDLHRDDQRILEALAKLPVIDPPIDQRARFRARAARSAGSRWRVVRVALAAAAAVAVILGAGWYVGRRQQADEVALLRAQLDRSLAELSVATRFQAVTVTGTSHVRDPRLIDALIHALLTDQSTHVRIAAVEAIGKLASPAILVETAVRVIPGESSPFVHAALLQAASSLDHTGRGAVASALLARSDLDPTVRTEASSLLKEQSR